MFCVDVPGAAKLGLNCWRLAATAAGENPANEVLAKPAGKFIKFAVE